MQFYRLCRSRRVKGDLVLSETFAATAFTPNADHSDGTNDAWCRAGNLVDDGQMRYA
ncbi:MAG: hypothetical protein FLDDKLPJ_03288 [Phycisphaerae bacterium]|nr:hypothetical protein [Phycisphaerae bacterium]